MNVAAVGGTTSSTAVDPSTQTDFRTRMEQAMAPVANLFGMTSDQLMSAVQQSGESLADYAAAHGVSKDQLTAAIKQGLQQNAPNGVQLSDTQLTNLADRIENHKGGGHHHHHGGSSVNSTTSTDPTTSTTPNLQADLDQLIADLSTLSSTSSGVSADGSTSSSAGTSTDPNAVSVSQLLDLATRFDQQL